MRSNAKNPNSPAYNPGGGSGVGGLGGYMNDGEVRQELNALHEQFVGFSGKGFEGRYRDLEFLEKFLRLHELRSELRGSSLELEEELSPSEALRRIVEGRAFSSRPALISRLIRSCPGLESQDPALSRFREHLGYREEEVMRLHVNYLDRIVGSWELPRPSGVLFFPAVVREAVGALDSVSSLAELSLKHAKTLILMLTDPERCGCWEEPTISAARCPHCGGQELSPMSEGDYEGRLSSLQFAHHRSRLEVSRMCYRICFGCGYVLPFVGRGKNGLDAVRKLFRSSDDS